MDKFLGKPKGQKAVATIREGEGELNSEPEEASKGSGTEETVSVMMTTLAQLMEHQKVLADQIAALRDQDF
jgi:hypothetical protein